MKVAGIFTTVALAASMSLSATFDAEAHDRRRYYHQHDNNNDAARVIVPLMGAIIGGFAAREFNRGHRRSYRHDNYGYGGYDGGYGYSAPRYYQRPQRQRQQPYQGRLCWYRETTYRC